MILPQIMYAAFIVSVLWFYYKNVNNNVFDYGIDES